ncbi:MAG: HEAT repeat domain-containing protein [Pedobacter sp.]|nr:MAG: HEAT repeat domain-containing protein [Pedobacter sp.]
MDFGTRKRHIGQKSIIQKRIQLEKAGKSDEKVMNMLASTLNNDQNTNVRLAALSLMEKFSADKHVSDLLVNSLNKQDDPMVQLGLVSLLGRMKNIKIDDKLQALANNPDTFAAVRDEAYNILLNQNKL